MTVDSSNHPAAPTGSVVLNQINKSVETLLQRILNDFTFLHVIKLHDGQLPLAQVVVTNHDQEEPVMSESAATSKEQQLPLAQVVVTNNDQHEPVMSESAAAPLSHQEEVQRVLGKVDHFFKNDFKNFFEVDCKNFFTIEKLFNNFDEHIKIFTNILRDLAIFRLKYLRNDGVDDDSTRYQTELDGIAYKQETCRLLLIWAEYHLRKVWDQVKATRISFGVIGGLALGGVMVVAIPAGLATFGFGAGGVVAGSTAAQVQSVLYGAWTGGAFSVCQSIGAAGLSSTAIAATTATTTAVTTGGVTSIVLAEEKQLSAKTDAAKPTIVECNPVEVQFSWEIV